MLGITKQVQFQLYHGAPGVLTNTKDI